MSYNIAALLGSERSGSLNQRLFEAARSHLSTGFKLVPVQGMLELPLYSQEIEQDGIPDRVSLMAEEIRHADAIMLISPEYNYSIPGPLKNQIDWLSRVEDQPFHEKPVSLMTASPSPMGGIRMQYHLRDVFVALGAWLVNRPEVAVAFADQRLNENGTIGHEQTQNVVKDHLRAFETMIK